jgi:IS30 family transposase
VSTLDDQVAFLTRRGWTMPRIAAELGCSERTVGRARERTGVANPAPRPMSAEDLELAEQLFADGCSISEVEDTLGRARGTLARRYRGRGWTYRQSGEFRQMQRRMSS